MSNSQKIVILAALAASSPIWASVAFGQPVCPVMLTASDAADGAEFGSSVALDGNVAVVGAPRDSERGLYAGAAYVLRFDGVNWVEEQKLLAADGFTQDYFGYSVALDGGRIVVGAIYDDDDGPASGAAYVFRYEGGVWTQEQKLTTPGFSSDLLFGLAVAIDGGKVVIGAPGYVSGSSSVGAVYVFELQGTQWTLEQSLSASDAAAGDYLGFDVDIENGKIVAGAKGNDDQGNLSGSAYVFRDDGTNWVQEAKLLPSDGTTGDQFGHSVAISVGAVLIGAYTADSGATDSGAAYVFRFNGLTWVQEAKLSASNPAQHDDFGGAVALLGNTALVGTWRYGAGKAYTFRYASGVWTEAQRIRNPLATGYPGRQDGYAWALALSGDDALIGAKEEDLLCPGNTLCNSGAAYLVMGLSEPDCNANGIPDVCDADLDCNANGIQDICDTAGGASADCNANEVPDECLGDEGDCNGNQTPDECDISGGASEDCNDNTTPDECDLGSGTSQDCDASGTPDECELDCNDNGLHDACDLYAGTSQDCNTNGFPDECGEDCNANGLDDSCDIAAGTSADCTDNGTPDECEPDCNSNAVPDSCDIGAGSSLDCNENDVPDECDLTANNDCNSNGVPDECEADCNENGIPDACDLVSGTSQDCSDNGVPDECEPDCNQNGLTDVCEIADGLTPDCDNNGVPDECSWAQQARVAAFEPEDVEPLRQAFDQGLWPPPLALSGPDGADEFGAAVSLSGDRLVAGAFNDNNLGDPYFTLGFGAAYVFRHEDGGTPLDPRDDAWLAEAKLTASDAERSDRFGFAVSLDGDRAAIGADDADVIDGQGQERSNSGAVYIFDLLAGEWTQTAKLAPSDAESWDTFGISVELDGDDLVVGNSLDDDGGLNSGSVYVFHWNGSAWQQAAKLIGTNAVQGRQLGNSVALSGDVAAATATGAVYIFRRNGSTWSQEARLILSAKRVALSGDTLLIGHENVAPGGTASVLRWDGDSWELEAQLSPSQLSAGDFFGSAVAIEGDLAAIGARHWDGAAVDSGAAYVFRRNGVAWEEEARLLAGIASAGDELGTAVSIGGERVSAGAPGEHEGGEHAGAAYVFVNLDGNANGTPDTCETVCPPDPPATPAGRWLYWTDIDDHGIRRAGADGGAQEVLPVQTNSPAGLAIDGTGGRMYWTESQSGWIKRADLDGSCVESLLRVTNAQGQPVQLRGIALDAGAGKLYWADYSRDAIHRAKVNGSQVETLIDHQESVRGYVGLTLDLAAGQMYWAESNGNRIMRANLDGSAEVVVVPSGPTGTEGPYYMALDKLAGWLYWTEFGTWRIKRARLDGSAVETLYTNPDGPPIGLTLDLANARVSWTLLSGNIRQAELTGTGVLDVVSSLTSPWGLAISPSSEGYALPDYAVMVECLGGPGATPSPGSPWTSQSCLGDFDFDADQDVDLKDVASFTRGFRAP